MSERQCLERKQPISGRSDKRFCGDQCRNVYNNRDQREHKRNIYKVNRRLLQNYRILRKLNKGDKTKVTQKNYSTQLFRFHISQVSIAQKLERPIILCMIRVIYLSTMTGMYW